MIFDEGILTRRDAFRCEIAVIGTAKIFLQFLEGKEEIDLSKLTSYITEIHTQLLKLLRDFFTKKSIRKLEDIFSYFGGLDFIETVLYDEQVSGFKKELTISLRETLDPFIRQNREALQSKFKHLSDYLSNPRDPINDITSGKADDSNSFGSSLTFTEFAANHELSIHSTNDASDESGTGDEKIEPMNE